MPRGYFYKTGYLVKGDTLEELAGKLGIDADGPEGDRRRVQPGRGARRGPGVRPRLHAVQPLPRRHGAQAEPEPGHRWARARTTRRRSRWATWAPSPASASTSAPRSSPQRERQFPGLLAVGAAAVSVFGGGYPGYGSHIGPALVFGYRAGRDVARLAAERGTGPRGRRLRRRLGASAGDVHGQLPIGGIGDQPRRAAHERLRPGPADHDALRPRPPRRPSPDHRPPARGRPGRSTA